jgi:hypothetical protein
MAKSDMAVNGGVNLFSGVLLYLLWACMLLKKRNLLEYGSCILDSGALSCPIWPIYRLILEKLFTKSLFFLFRPGINVLLFIQRHIRRNLKGSIS